MDSNDLLSEVFSTLRIRSSLYFKTEFSGDYTIEIPQEQRRIRFHLVLQGQVWLTPEGMEPVYLTAGDIALVPDGVAQVLSNKEELNFATPVPLDQALAEGDLSNGVFSYGPINNRDNNRGQNQSQYQGPNQGGDGCRLLCGFCQFDEAMDHPILVNLPPLLVIRQKDLGAEPWTAATLRLLGLEAELAGQGGNGILARLLEIIFIQLVRRTTLKGGPESKGFIAALSDLQLSKALSAIHQAPQDPWKVSSLAERAGMSRARFADHFTSLVGMPPIAYLTIWRLMRARFLLASTNFSMEEIAEQCGYASVPSFSSRFKRQFGIGPGAYRKNAQA